MRVFITLLVYILRPAKSLPSVIYTAFPEHRLCIYALQLELPWRQQEDFLTGVEVPFTNSTTTRSAVYLGNYIINTLKSPFTLKKWAAVAGPWNKISTVYRNYQSVFVLFWGLLKSTHLFFMYVRTYLNTPTPSEPNLFPLRSRYWRYRMYRVCEQGPHFISTNVTPTQIQVIEGKGLLSGSYTYLQGKGAIFHWGNITLWKMHVHVHGWGE